MSTMPSGDNLENIIAAIDKKMAPAAAPTEDGEQDGGDASEEDAGAPDTGEAEKAEADQDAETADDEDADAEPVEKPATYKVKVDGEELEVTLEEALQGYSRETDYRRKTQAVADKEKAFEAIKQSAIDEARKGIEAERAEYKAALDYVAKDIQARLGTDEELSQLRATDPTGYAVRVADQQRLLGQLGNIQTAQAEVQRKEQSEKDTAIRQRAADEAGKLLAAIPDWKDPVKQRDGIQQLYDYAVKVRGFTPAEFGQVMDHRILLGLHDAAQLHALKSKKPEVVKKPSQQPAVQSIKPSAPTQMTSKATQIQKATERLKKNGGKVEDVARLLAAKFG